MDLHQPTVQTPFVLSFGPAPSIECLTCGKVRDLPHRRGFVEPGDITGIEEAHECGPATAAWDQHLAGMNPMSVAPVSTN
jgi:hypothetical protein